MTLLPGQRLLGGPREVYEVVGPLWESAGLAYHRVRKGFWNYRESDRSLYEAHPDEALDLLAREVRDAEPTRVARALEIEIREVLSLPGQPWLPTPVDRLGIDPDAPRTVLVLADLGGKPVSFDPAQLTPARGLRLAREAMELLAVFHGAGLAAGGFGPEDIVLGDQAGRWTFLVTHRVRRDPSLDARRADLRAWVEFATPMLEASGSRTVPERGHVESLLECVPRARSAVDLMREARRRPWSALFRRDAGQRS